jgi:hypothetical protein
MTSRGRAFVQLAILIGVIGGLILFFPRALAFTEMAARELRYFWWLILLLALAGWLIWGFKKRR